ncbi:sugar phosphate isomerase/epimerase family protein [Mesorhizobium sp. RMAD-H1]|uniref:sugar phosphate isomerase/epimerase family protein n=1 Tax=Mesorhizobium sp. RMAD-H1 TaxID=2587065 RepID=UPI0016205D67|nr:sugar phosphate isomerase/epimerase family protein [Mesorhizobium sp. RMAD-H1]MBB2972284.1 protein FrlC [Mesorhizobium sp. RMAD-H1]
MSKLKPEQLIGANFAFQHFPFEKVAATLREFGFRQMELWGIAPHLDLFHMSERKLDEVARILEDNDLTVRAYTPEQVLYPINIASGDPELRHASIERFCRGADICARLGADYLFLTPGRGFENEPMEDAWARSVEAISRIAEYAKSLGIRCLIEPLQRTESNIVTDVSGLKRMFDEIGADNIDIVLDLVAMATAGDSVADYTAFFGNRLVHVHIVDGTPSGHLVWGDGNLPLGQYLRELGEAGFSGTLTFEPLGQASYALDPVAAWKRNLEAVRPWFDDAGQGA